MIVCDLSKVIFAENSMTCFVRPPPELISLMRKAHSEYLQDVKNTVTHQEEVKENIKVHLGIYERRTSASVKRDQSR